MFERPIEAEKGCFLFLIQFTERFVLEEVTLCRDTSYRETIQKKHRLRCSFQYLIIVLQFISAENP